ncbi:MAG: V-type ATP synthase subunit A, partial [Candidatus Omnitrophica bacterium]|nr:V-type ATP synthase subunit A [Candidatus Omnitrophota bacterium]
KIFDFIYGILTAEFEFEDKEKALEFFQKLRQEFRGWNSAAWDSAVFKKTEKDITSLLESKIIRKSETVDKD